MSSQSNFSRLNNISHHIIRIFRINSQTISVDRHQKHFIKKSQIRIYLTQTTLCFWLARAVASSTWKNQNNLSSLFAGIHSPHSSKIDFTSLLLFGNFFFFRDFLTANCNQTPGRINYDTGKTFRERPNRRTRFIQLHTSHSNNSRSKIISPRLTYLLQQINNGRQIQICVMFHQNKAGFSIIHNIIIKSFKIFEISQARVR